MSDQPPHSPYPRHGPGAGAPWGDPAGPPPPAAPTQGLPGFPVPPPGVTPPSAPGGPPRSARRPWLHPLGYFATLIVGLAIGGATANGSDDPPAPQAVAAAAAEVEPDEPVEDPTTEEPDPVEPAAPTKDDYAVSLKTLSKECFGSAGCNVNVRVRVSADPSTAGTAGELTVRITGGDDGAVLQTVDLDEEGKYSPVEVMVSTPRSSSKIGVKIVSYEPY